MDNKRPFDQVENCVTYTDSFVVEDNYPVLLVTHDDDDHTWQFLSWQSGALEDCMMVSLKSAVERDKTLYDIAYLQPWYVATREQIGWERSVYTHNEYFPEGDDEDFDDEHNVD